MQAKQSVTTLVGALVLLLFALTVISFVPGGPTIQALAPYTQQDPQPHAGFEQLENSVAAGVDLDVSIFFANFPCTDENNDGTCNSDDTFTTVTYRFDLLQGGVDGPDADNCEGQGFGNVRTFSPSQYSHWSTTGTIPLSINKDCTPGSYVVKCTITYTEDGATEEIELGCNCGITIDPPLTPTPTPTETHIPTATATAGYTPTPTNTPMPPPSVSIEGLPPEFNEGQDVPFTMVFDGIDDSDTYHYRADVTNSDNDDVDVCEGSGLGGDGQYTGPLNGLGQIRVPGEIDAACPPGTYTVTVTLIGEGGFTDTATKDFRVIGLSLSPIETDTPTATATNTATATATAGKPTKNEPPPQVQPPSKNDPPQQQPTATPTETPEPTATATNTSTPEPTATATDPPRQNQPPPQQQPTATHTNTPEPTATATHTNTPEPTATATNPPRRRQPPPQNQPPVQKPQPPTATATATVTSAPTPTPTADIFFAPPPTQDEPTPTATHTPTAAGRPTPTATATATPSGSLLPTLTPTPTPTGGPTIPPTSDLPDDLWEIIVIIDIGNPNGPDATPDVADPTPTPTSDGDDTDGDDTDGDDTDGDDTDGDGTDGDDTDGDDTDGDGTDGDDTDGDDTDGDDTDDDTPDHYAGDRTVWSCQENSDLVNWLAALRQTMTPGSYPQAVTQPVSMNARLGPGLAYDVITTLPQGTRANIIGVDPRGEWYQIERTGLDIPVWIHQSLATVEGSLANVPTVSAEELAKLPISGATGSRPIAIIQPEVMNVRIGPGIDYDVLTTLPQGTQVKVVGIDPNSDWLLVELDGLTSLGWVYRDLVQVDCPLVNVLRITETEISQTPAALTQTYALFAYSGPGLAYDIVATIPRGTWAEIIAVGDCPPNVWYQVIVPGLDEPVWVIRDFVKVAIGSLAGIPRYGVTDFFPPAADDRPIAVTQPITMNVRSGPGLEYNVVAVVPQDTQARIHGIDPTGDWILVELEGHNALVWIYCHMTEVRGSVEGVRRVTAAEVAAQPAVLVQPGAVFARSGPGTEYSATALLPKGTWAPITGIGPDPQWLRIQIPGLDAPVWVHTGSVKLIGSIASVPHVTQ